MKKALIFLLSLSISIALHSKELYFKHLGISDGLSQTCIQSIYQDEVGAMWFGSSEGLNRYNGKEIKIYQPSQDKEGLTHNEITELCGDGKGHIYIRSGNDLVVFDLYKERFTCLRKNDVKGLFCRDGKLWVICDQSIYTYLPDEKTLKPFAAFPAEWGEGRSLYVDEKHVWAVTPNRLLCFDNSRPGTAARAVTTLDKGRCISKDRSGNLWIGTWNGLYRVDADENVTLFLHRPGQEGLSNNQVRCVMEDSAGYIWVGTFRGLDCYHPATDTWSHYIHQDYNPNSLSHNSVLALYQDNHHNVWVGTYYGGVNFFTPYPPNKQFYTASLEHPDRLSFPFVGRMTEDDAGNLWICTEGGGLNKLNPMTGQFTRYTYQEGNPRSVGNNNLKSIFYHQPTQRLYVGTHTGGLSIFDIRRNTFSRTTGSPQLAANIINEIQSYKDGLAILTQGGLFFMDFGSERLSSFPAGAAVKELLERTFTYETFFIDSREHLWLALSAGGLICIHLPTGGIEKFETNADNPSSIGKFKVVHIFESSDGELYFGTIGSGLFKYRPQNHSFHVYNTQNHSLPNNYCYYIRESPLNHKLLLLHNKGLSVFNPQTEAVEQTYHLFQQNYSQGSTLYLSREGTLYIGGANGLASLPEAYLYSSPREERLCFEKLLIFNREVLPDDAGGILHETLARTPGIRLKHDQNHVTVTFSSFNYLSERNKVYEYCFENLDKEWTPTTGHSVTYTNIPPGNYTLRVRAVEPEAAGAEEISLDIHVAAPFYANPYAYTLYALLLAAVLGLFLHFKLRQARLQSSLEGERKEKERIEELNQSKLRFFTNISHEFRTPLTLIIGQLEAIMQINKLEPSVYKRIVRVYKNSRHMRNLITELLDFRKQEQGYLKLKVEERDLVPFIHEIYSSFYEYAQMRNISYSFKHAEDSIHAWFDPVQLQKVIFNLLSNAFKYTREGGTVTVGLRQTSTQVLVSVSDNGAGIPEEAIQKIFDRFYQADFTPSSLSLGTGIGLALAKGIMEAHHGKIEIKSKVNEGSEFTLSLLLGNGHFDKADFAVSKQQADAVYLENTSSLLASETVAGETSGLGETTAEGCNTGTTAGSNKPETEAAGNSTETEAAGNKPVLLLVEDNEDLLEMLHDLFSTFYEVHTARNGREGLAAAAQIQPDLIVSDVMMPEMSGKEMCYKLKNNVELSHIPIVLLTAQNSVEYIVEGYMFGADDYVTKPFNVKILLARCSNLIRNKQQLIAHYSKLSATQITEAIPTVNAHDKELLDKSIAIVRKNFESPDFDVTSLASALCMGRSKLYMQFKQMIGLTPNEFILKVKLDEAMSMLKNQPGLNISEISTALGFSSPRYFSKCFKAFFGVAPQGVRKRH